ncbi:T9SS type B sorting domain-containing protein [Rudanella paleaurantiibacter]|uniref:T9SS type B sorting domain-containing protein n=1 Tax=Rudanella paleaurantiibacter TaxID=2614655 RepID=A0A7J5U2B4_9BACT|nr:gliding motility-associated C-terminal domain-containing protein [Rudanella paleaurantiibacter]KAB7731821.1 T9SS type B sorting domain-containing protein [Rudanella paleaurantiibacter]
MRYAFTYFRFFGVLLCLLGLSSLWPVLGQIAPPTSSTGTGNGLPSGISIRRPCVQTEIGSGDSQCKGEPTTFRDATPGVASWKWEFDSAPISGTATPGASTSTTSYSVVQYGYSSQGLKTVTVTRTFSNSALPAQTETFQINVGTAPREFQNWRTDTTICKGQVLTLDPYPSGAPSGVTYEWAPKGEITQTISVTGSGCYSVEVTNAFGCTTENRIQVQVCPEQAGSPGAKWYFGNNAGLDFAGGGSPSPIDDGKLSTIEGASSISDDKGNVLFYTDGVKVYDADGNVMGAVQYDANGKLVVDPTTSKPVITTAVASLGGSQISTQSALIVPKGTCRGCEYQYYVYTTAEINGTRQLTYSIVDMRKNDGKGAIVETNLPVAGSSTTALSTERSAGVKNEQDSTYWVITRDFGGNTFRITHITRNAVPEQKTVVITQSRSQTLAAQGEGYIKIGPAPQSTTATSATGTSGTATNPGSNTTDGVVRPVAMIVPGVPGSNTAIANNIVELYKFNDETGTLEYDRTIDLGPAPPSAYGVEFSPDGRSLYVTLKGDPTSGTAVSSYLLRYDLTITDPDQLTAARSEVATSTTQQFGALQIGPDGRIYMSIPGQSELGVIENPNASLLDTLRFNPRGQSLGSKTGQLGLPNQIANFNQPPSNGAGLSHEGECIGDTTQFTIGPYCPDLKERYTINFGDGSAPYSGTATQASHRYTRPGSYTATLTVETFQKGPNNSFGPSCTVVTATDVVNIASVPQSITLNDQFVCRMPMSTTLSIDVQAQNYAWVYANKIIGRGKTFEATRNGTYIAFAFNENPECFVRDDANVLFTRPNEPFTLASDPVLCQGSSTTVGFAAIAPSYNSFNWSNGQTTKAATVNAAGVYSVTATYRNPNSLPNAADLCTNTASVTVTERQNPRLTASTVNPSSCTILNGSILVSPQSSGTFTYAWTGNNQPLLTTGNSLSALGEGTYTVRVTDQLSCSSLSNYTLRSPVNTLAITPVPRDQLCSRPGSGTVSLNATGGTPALYVWRDGANAIVGNASVLTGINSGTYTVQVSDVNGCSATASTRVGLDPTGFADLGPPQDKCAGDLALLQPVSATLANNQYQWSNGLTTPTISVTAPGTYSVRVSNPNGCTGTASVQITDRPAPAIQLAPQYRFCVGDGGSTTLVAGGPASASFVWGGGGGPGRLLRVSAVGRYTVQATDPSGCTAVASTQVVDYCEPRVFTPEAFTPNGDGLNDQFDVYSAYTTGFEIKIFNRWGEVVFASDNPEIRWDGTYRGEVYPPMMYAYVITYGSQYDPQLPRVVRRGSVLLIR